MAVLHPLVISFLLLDLFSLLFLLQSSLTAFKVVLHWNPESSQREQITLETRYETASVRMSWSFFLSLSASLLLIICFAIILPEIIPGAMCGTGVIQAAGRSSWTALILRVILLILFSSWMFINNTDRKSPLSPLAVPKARLLLLMAPLMLMSLYYSFSAVFRMDVQSAVNCCAAVYEQLDAPRNIPVFSGIHESSLVLIFMFLSALLVVTGLLILIQSYGSALYGGFLFCISIFWSLAAAFSLVRVFSAYYYQVLHHHCPWCLFLPEHRLVGFPLFFFILTIPILGGLSWTAGILRNHLPGPEIQHLSFLRKFAIGILTCLILYVLLATGPALLWRIRFGVWF